MVMRSLLCPTVSANGDIANSEINSSLKSKIERLILVCFIILTYDNSSDLSFAEMRTNYAGTEDDTVEFGINYKVTF